MVILFRSMISFGFSYFIVPWVSQAKPALPFGNFGMLIAVVGLLAVPLQLYGKRPRIAHQGSCLRMLVIDRACAIPSCQSHVMRSYWVTNPNSIEYLNCLDPCHLVLKRLLARLPPTRSLLANNAIVSGPNLMFELASEHRA